MRFAGPVQVRLIQVQFRIVSGAPEAVNFGREPPTANVTQRMSKQEAHFRPTPGRICSELLCHALKLGQLRVAFRLDYVASCNPPTRSGLARPRQFRPAARVNRAASAAVATRRWSPMATHRWNL